MGADNYFVVDVAGQLEFQWFAEAPDLPLLGYFVDPSERILDEKPRKTSGKLMSSLRVPLFQSKPANISLKSFTRWGIWLE